MVFNEVDIVDTRLRQWEAVPNVQHLATEGLKTHAGLRERELMFHGNPFFYNRRLKVASVDLEDIDPWENERRQRDSLEGMCRAEEPDPEDLVIYGDADEIVRASKLDEILEATEVSPVQLELRMHYYGPQWVAPYLWLPFVKAFRWRMRPPSRHLAWNGLPYGGWTEYRHHGHVLSRDPNDPEKNLDLPIIHDAGWHLSYWGGLDRVKEKIMAFSHTEHANEEFLSGIEYRAGEGWDNNGTKLLPWDGRDMPL